MGAMDPHTYLHSYLRKACPTASAPVAVAPLSALSGDSGWFPHARRDLVAG